MYTDYLFYLNALVEAQRGKQILIVLLTWIVMLGVGSIFSLINHKLKNI